MEVRIQFPEPVGKEILRLPDRDAFVSSAVVEALASRRARQAPPGSQRPEKPSRKWQPPPLNDREREDAWRRSNRDLLQGRFAGHWVVLEGEEIMAHSEDAAKAVEEARGKGVLAPFVFFVEPPRKPGVVRIGL